MPGIRCKGRKTEKVCNKDNMCNWNGNSCEPGHYETFLQICKTKSGKKSLIEYADKLGLVTNKLTIPEICLIVSEHINNLEINLKQDAAVVFNNIITGNHNVAPIITKSEVKQISQQSNKESSSEGIRKLLQFPMGDRIRFYKHVSTLAKLHKDSLCNLKKEFSIVKRIGTPSINGEAYIVKANYKNTDMIVAAKLMPSLLKNKKEIKLYEKFNDYVLQNKNPHFPIIYEYQECKSCIYQGALQNRPNKKCLVVLNELANGDLKTFLSKLHFTKGQFVSMILQTIIGCMGFEKENIVHNDLHWGNILYHDVPSYANKYTHYKIQNDDIYILNRGQHWVLWDFGEVKPAKKEFKSSRVDIYRIANLYRWLRADGITLNQECSDICRYIIGYTHNYALKITYYDLLKSIKAIYDTNDRYILINPSTKPTNIINHTPFHL